MVTASFDRTAAVVDVRAAEATRAFPITADAEKVCWDPHTGYTFAVTTEDGMLRAFDVRKSGSAALLWEVQAHKEPASGLDWNPAVADIIATGSQACTNPSTRDGDAPSSEALPWKRHPRPFAPHTPSAEASAHAVPYVRARRTSWSNSGRSVEAPPSSSRSTTCR